MVTWLCACAYKASPKFAHRHSLHCVQIAVPDLGERHTQVARNQIYIRVPSHDVTLKVESPTRRSVIASTMRQQKTAMPMRHAGFEVV